MPLPFAGALATALLLALPPASDAAGADAGAAAPDASLARADAGDSPGDPGAASPAAGAIGAVEAIGTAEPEAEAAVSDEVPPAAEEGAGARDEEASRELEELEAAEAAAIDDEGDQRAAELFLAMRLAGPGSPLGQRLQDVLGPGRALPVVPDQAELEAAVLAEIGAFDLEKAARLYDIPIDLRPQVAEYIRFFQTRVRGHFVKWVGRSSRYLPMMKKALREAGLPEDTVYLSMIESGFAPHALSRAKAAGLWQFIEPTGRRFGLRIDFWVDERRDPVKSTYAAAAYLKELYAEFGDWRLAWAGYNAGAGMVRLARARSGSNDFWEQAEARRTYRRETKHYVPKLMAAALVMKHLKVFGFSEDEYVSDPPLEYEDVQVPEATDLEVVARAAGTTVQALKELNPALKRWCTPPSRNPNDTYTLHLPVGARERFLEEFPKIAPKDRMRYVVHVVQKGDTLSKIAERYGSVTEIIMRANGIRDSRRVRLKAELVVPVPRGRGGREQLVQTARRQGFRPAPAEEEIPAAPPPPRRSRSGMVAGSVRTVQEGGRAKVVYAVASGDSLWAIARRFDVHVAQIKEWNGFGKNPKLQVGQEAVIFPGEKAQLARTPPAPAPAGSAGGGAAAASPTAPAAPAPAGKARVHVVQEGDSLWTISRRYQVTVEDLKRWNNLSRARLKIGVELAVSPP